MPSLKRIAAPAEYPVTLAEAKAHLRVDHSDDDVLIQTLIKAATGHVEGPNGFLGRALIDQTWELALDAFPTKEIQIPLPPLIEVLSVKYDDVSGNEQTVDAANYSADSYSEPAWIIPDIGGWPSSLDAVNSVRIRFRAGYLDTGVSPAVETVPTEIKIAILLLVGSLYEHRETMIVGQTIEQIPWSAEQLMLPHRVHLGFA